MALPTTDRKVSNSEAEESYWAGYQKGYDKGKAEAISEAHWEELASELADRGYDLRISKDGIPAKELMRR
jgi:hypothetical protein